jgi:tetratricopeptide (TPR) repeat protein
LLAVYHRWDIHHLSGLDMLAIIEALAVPIGLLILSRRIGRGPFCAVAVYGLTISPVLGLASFYTETYSFVADHYQYIPCIGLFAFFVGSGDYLLRRLQSAAGTVTPRGQKIGGVVVSACVLAALIPVTLKQALVYIPSIHLWRHNIKYNPDAFAALDNIAIYDLKHHHPDRCMALLQKAWLLSHKQDPTVNTDLGDMYYTYYHDPAKAMPYYRRSLAVDPQQPTLILALVKWYEQHKNWRMAYNDLIHGVEVMPNSADIHYQLGKLDLLAGNLPAAAGQFAVASRIEPHNTKANYHMAAALVGLGRAKQAVAYFRRVVEVSPQFVPGHVSYAHCLYQLGHFHRALRQLKAAEKLAPRLPVIHMALADVLKKLGHDHQAAAEQHLAASLSGGKK